MRLCAPGRSLRAVQPVGDRLVEDLVDERRLARARHAGHAAEHAERDLHVDVLEVVLRRALDLDVARRACAAWPAPSICARPARNWPVSDSLTCIDLRRRCPAATTWPPCSPAPGPDVDQVVGGAHRALVVLDDDHRVAEVAQPLQRARSGARCRAGAGRSTARRGCRARRPATSRSASPAGSAAPRRPTASPPRAPATGSRRRRCRGSAAARRSRAGSAARSARSVLGQLERLEPVERALRATCA